MTDLISYDFFRRSPIGQCLRKCFIPATNLKDKISCGFSRTARFEHLEAKHWTYRIVIYKSLIPGPYLMGPIPFDFFQGPF